MPVLTGGTGITLNESPLGTLNIIAPQVEKVAFAAAGAIPIIFTVARSLATPTVRASAGTPVLNYSYSSTGTGTFTAVTVWPHSVAAGSVLLVNLTDISTASWVAVGIPAT